MMLCWRAEIIDESDVTTARLAQVRTKTSVSMMEVLGSSRDLWQGSQFRSTRRPLEVDAAHTRPRLCSVYGRCVWSSLSTAASRT